MTEPFGTTPLPTASRLHVVYDPDAVLAPSSSECVTPQQPVQQQIAAFEAEKVEHAVHGAAVLAVNQHFVVYVVKNGLIRVLHRHSTIRALLRAHQGQSVTDIQFFHDGDVLATAGSSESSKVVIWRVFERSPDILSEQLLEIRSSAITMTRVVWHPFNPNQFWMLHKNNNSNSSSNNNNNSKQTATLVETTRITTTPDPLHNHAVAVFYSETVLQESGTVLQQTTNAGASLVDLAWSGRDTRYVLAAYDNGQIVLYDCKTVTLQTAISDGCTAVAVPSVLQAVNQGSAVSRCLFLPHDQTVHQYHSNTTSSNSNSSHPPPWTTCFATGSDNNTVLTLWSAFAEGAPPVKLQVLQIASASPKSYILNVCFGVVPATAAPPSCFVTACCREQGRIYAFHCKAEWSPDKKPLLVGSDYVVPFTSKYPVYSCTAKCVSATDISEEELSEQGGLVFDMKLFSYQTAAVQCLTLTSYMCLPPASTYTDPTPGVRVSRLSEASASSNAVLVSELDTNNDDNYEDYDVDDDDDDDLDEAPDPSSLPVPNGATAPSKATNNPFANWLGAFAAVATKGEAPPPHPSPAPPTILSPPPGVTPPPPPPNPSFLSPMEILASQPATMPASNSISISSRHSTPMAENMQDASKKKKKGSSKVVKAEDSNVSILQRGNTSPAVAVERSPQPAATATASMGVVDHAAIVEEVRRIVREEIRATVIPSIQQAVNETKQISDSIQPLQTSVDALAQQGVTTDNNKIAKAVADSVKEPLRAAFAESIKSVLIPTLESVTGQVIQQFSEHLETTNHSNDGKMESISKQLSTMTALLAELTNEVQSLRASVAATRAAEPPVVAPPAPVPAVDPAEAQRALILSLLGEGKYQEAFTRAVSNPTVDMTTFCCRSADLQEVLGGAQPALSQPILLCLLQQLGTVLVTSQDPQLELEWLQEIALTLDPVDSNIQRHVPSVLQQVVTNINQRMQQSNDPMLRRQLQRMLQVVRGMQMG